MTPGPLYDDGTGDVPGGVDRPVERVIVVGAGMAGLATANALTHAGVDCVLLEARDRPGGRTHTVDFGGLPVDVGGSWIHHPGGNPMTRLADQLGLERVSGDFLEAMVLFDIEAGKPLDPPDRETLRKIYQGFDQGLRELSAELGPDVDMVTACERYLDRVIEPGRIRDLARSRLHGWVEADASGPVADVSLGFMLSPYQPGYEGDDIGDFVVGGYRMIVDGLATGVDIRYGAAVDAIRYDANGVRVILSDGTVEECSHVVITVPLGVLKSMGIGFEPGLPAEKVSAIERLGFGRFEKVVIRFEEAFWTANGIPHLLPVNTDASPRVRAIFGMDNAFGDPVVTAFDSGAGAVFGATGDDEVKAMIVDLLEAASGVAAAPVVDLMRTNWAGDPWTRGGYTYCRPGSGYDDIATLAEPVAGRVLFAGEATSRERVGYADGALTTGIREAKRLLGVPEVTLGRLSSR